MEIDVTDVNMRELVKAAYGQSRPLGMGFLHYEPGDLSDEEADEILENSSDDRNVFYMDYVEGRAVKLGATRRGDRIFIREPWFDHTPDQFDDMLLIARGGLKMTKRERMGKAVFEAYHSQLGLNWEVSICKEQWMLAAEAGVVEAAKPDYPSQEVVYEVREEDLQPTHEGFP